MMRHEELLKSQQFIDSIEEFPAMPRIALDLMAMLNDNTASVSSLVDEVKVDEAMVSFILKACNSPFYGVKQEIRSINQAIALLGFSNLKSILMSYFMRNMYHISTKNPVKMGLWKHAISVASFSQVMAQYYNVNQDEAYSAGLLHDIGKLALYLFNGPKFEEVQAKLEQTNMDSIDAEHQSFGFSHTEAGFFLFENWDISDFFKGIVRFHHEPDLHGNGNKTLHIVSFANRLVHKEIDKKDMDLLPYIKEFNLTTLQLNRLTDNCLQVNNHFQSLI